MFERIATAVLRSASPSPSASASPGPLESAVKAAVSDPPAAATNFWEALNKWQENTFQLGILGTIIFAAIVTLIAFLVLKLLQRGLEKKLGGNLRIFYVLLRVIVIVLAAMCVLMTINPLKDLGNAILASSGIASVIVGLAAQETLGNLFSGLSLSLGKPFVVGEYIEILNTSPAISGTVKSITLRHTVLLDASNKDIVVPNSIIDKDMIRRTPEHVEEKPSYVNNFLDVGVAYSSDIEKAITILQRLVAAQPEFVDLRTEAEKKQGVPEVTVRVQNLGDSSVDLRAWVWTKNVGDGFRALSDLRLEVKKAFDAEGIEIPYPYRNVILQNAPTSDESTSSK